MLSVQVVQALLTGGPRQMRVVIASLRRIAEFGAAATASDFPAKPTLVELKGLATQAGLGAATAEYHLFGTSVMVLARKDGAPLPALPHGPLSAQLVGRPGYEGPREKATFWELSPRPVAAATGHRLTCSCRSPHEPGGRQDRHPRRQSDDAIARMLHIRRKSLVATRCRFATASGDMAVMQDHLHGWPRTPVIVST